jgi:hypothetical protein
MKKNSGQRKSSVQKLGGLQLKEKAVLSRTIWAHLFPLLGQEKIKQEKQETFPWVKLRRSAGEREKS